jgi:hypothetical protein
VHVRWTHRFKLSGAGILGRPQFISDRAQVHWVLHDFEIVWHKVGCGPDRLGKPLRIWLCSYGIQHPHALLCPGLWDLSMVLLYPFPLGLLLSESLQTRILLQQILI